VFVVGLYTSRGGAPVLTPDTVCNETSGHGVLDKSNCVYGVHPMDEGGAEDGAERCLSEEMESNSI